MYLRGGMCEDHNRLDVRILGFYPVDEDIDELSGSSHQSSFQLDICAGTYQVTPRLQLADAFSRPRGIHGGSILLIQGAVREELLQVICMSWSGMKSGVWENLRVPGEA